MSKVSIELSTLTNIGDAIREKKGTTEEIAVTELGNEIRGIQSGGGDTTELENLIDESGVLDSTEGTVTEKIEQLIHATDLFFKLYELNYYGIHSVERIEFYIDWVKAVCFNYTRGLKFLKGVDTTNLTTCRNIFLACNLLETIELPFDVSKHNAYHLAGMFSGCNALVNVRFIAETIKESISFSESPLLSAESIQSIIDGLAAVETAQTLSLHKDVKAKLTDTQLATITGKNWTLA